MPFLKGSSRMSAPKIVKHGSLQKRSQNKGRFTAENYKRRYFILTKDHLKYYDGNSDRHGKKKGEISLVTAMVVEFVEDLMLENKKNAFQVVYKESSDFFTLYMVASSEEERSEWVEAIRNEAANRGANFLNKYHRGVWTKSLGKFNCCDQMDRNAVGCVLSTPEKLTATNHSSGLPSSTLSNAGNICPPPPPLRPMPALPAGRSPVYIAIYDYDPVEEGDLELCKGEEYEIQDNSREHWWLAKNHKGKQGYIPSNYVKKKFDLEIYDWYYKDLSRNQAESILKENSHEGCFLVRDSISTPGSYSLSLYTRESGLSVRHYHIKKNAQGFFYIAENHVFESIPDVINYHKFNSGGLVTRLREPPERTSKPTTAGFGHSQWEIDPKDLEIGEQLGAGCFGSVHKGSFRGQVVAVKRMKEHTMSEEAFKEEARTMTQLSHKNLVQLYGVVLKSRPMCIVTELMRYGALNNYLQRHRSRLMQQVSRLLDVCVQVCQGMTYLENRKFIHRDLAARNCLVGDNTVVKVADFGLARYVLDDEYQSSAGTKFPVKWAPPEVLQYTRFSSKSDVWAYGILMWEVFTCGDMPYKEKRNIDVVEYVVTQNKRLAKPANAPMIIYQIMMKCWDKDPDIRPSFADLQKQLSELNKEGDYPHID